MNKKDILLSSLWILTYLSFMMDINGNYIVGCGLITLNHRRNKIAEYFLLH